MQHLQTQLDYVHIVPPMAIAAAYLADAAATFKASLSIPLFVTGRINQPQEAELILARGQADVCGMTRALICDPLMPAKTLEGRAEDVRACIACNHACIGHFHKGLPISCIQHPETGRELQFAHLQPTLKRRRIMVVGGGPAGMKAAAVAAQRGHDVTLFEASAQLGGQVLLAQLLPRRSEFGGASTNLQREMTLAGVRVVRNTRVDRALVVLERPDHVIIATGAEPYWPAFERGGELQVVDAWQVLRDQVTLGRSVVDGIVDQLLTPLPNHQLEMLHACFPPGTYSQQSYSHEGEEAGYVLSGTFELWVGERHFRLAAGDSFSFASSEPHRYGNPGKVNTVVIWVITPPTF